MIIVFVSCLENGVTFFTFKTYRWSADPTRSFLQLPSPSRCSDPVAHAVLRAQMPRHEFAAQLSLAALRAPDEAVRLDPLQKFRRHLGVDQADMFVHFPGGEAQPTPKALEGRPSWTSL